MTVKINENLTATERVLVLGLGNILLKDEGVGVHIAKQLQGLALPDNVEVVDGGTAGLDMLMMQESSYKLVVIDATKAGGKPGAIYKAEVKGPDIDKLAKTFSPWKDLKISSHQFGLIEALAAAETCNCAPSEIVIIGIEPKQVDYGLELTEEVKQKVPAIINKVLEEIKNAVHQK